MSIVSEIYQDTCLGAEMKPNCHERIKLKDVRGTSTQEKRND